MKTWLRDDGIWVSEKPNQYVVCTDAIGNNVYPEDMVVKFNKYRLHAKVLYGKQLYCWTYTYKHRSGTEQIYPYDEFIKFIENGYIIPVKELSEINNFASQNGIQFKLPKIKL